MKSENYSPLVFTFSVLVSAATLALIFIGGLVTSTDSGISVPDWPLSFGRFNPPMVGGVLYEHGHRVVATVVGFFTVILAFLLALKDNRSWLRKAGWNALALVILQGAFGGLTVLLGLSKTVSIIHACMAQAFLCLVVAISVWTSRAWQGDIPTRSENANNLPLHHIGWWLVGTVYLQLIFGASVRHTGWGLVLHIAMVFVIATLGFLAFRHMRAARQHDAKAHPTAFLKLSSYLFFGILLQISLGILTFSLLVTRLGVLSHPAVEVGIITTHVTLGAVLLALSVILALWAHRSRPERETKPGAKASDYYKLTKPGVTLMAALTTLVGFFLGSQGQVSWGTLFHTFLGTLMVGGAAGTLNMVFEGDVDAKMDRTKKRPIPAGRLGPGEGFALGILLAVLGVVYLSWAVNTLTAVMAGLSLGTYLYIYTPLKKKSSLCLWVGAVAGALPPVMGWTAATGRLTWEAGVLFAILFFWQFPHTLSLSWLYRTDYSKAGLQMLPLNGSGTQGRRIAGIALLFSLVLLGAAGAPFLNGAYAIWFLPAVSAAGAWLLFKNFQFFQDPSSSRARSLFLASIAYIPVLLVFLVLNKMAGAL